MTKSHRDLAFKYFPVAWLGHFSLGMTYGFLGPIQPFLARQVNTELEVVSTIFSIRAVSVVVASLASGWAFSQLWAMRGQARLIFLSAFHLIIAVSWALLPFAQSFIQLAILISVMCLGTGAFDVGSNSLISYMISPKASRPFVQSLHALVSFGFAVVSFGMPHLLPSSFELVASDPVAASTDGVYSPLLWPSVIISISHLTTSVGFILQAGCGLVLPKYDPGDEATAQIPDEESTSKDIIATQDGVISRFKSFNTLVVFLSSCFYLFGNGVDCFFQAQTYSFAVFGPLKLSLSSAARVNQAYFGSYCAGRLVSICLAPFLTPSQILTASLAVCPICTGVLAWSPPDHTLLLAATAAMGFAVSFQFASMLTWMGAEIDGGMKSTHTSLVFVGANTGVFILPPLASYMFSRLGPSEPLMLAFAINLTQISVFVILTLVTTLHKKNRNALL